MVPELSAGDHRGFGIPSTMDDVPPDVGAGSGRMRKIGTVGPRFEGDRKEDRDEI